MYKKISEVGNGAFGRCFLCKSSDDALVVLKKIGYNDEALSQFSAYLLIHFISDEATILNELEHTSVIRAHQAHRSLASIYIVFEYMEGGNLDTLIKGNRESPFKESLVFSYCEQVLIGIVSI